MDRRPSTAVGGTDASMPQRVIVAELLAAFAREPCHEGRHVGTVNPIGSRCPQQITVADLASRLHIADAATAGAARAS